MKIYYQQEAIQKVDEYHGNIDNITKLYINQWKNEKIVIAFVDIYSFALLSKLDFDPLDEYSDIYCLNYIYTEENMRRNGYAANILKKIKKMNIIFTTFVEPTNLPSMALFSKECIHYNSSIMINVFRSITPISIKEVDSNLLTMEQKEKYSPTNTKENIVIAMEFIDDKIKIFKVYKNNEYKGEYYCSEKELNLKKIFKFRLFWKGCKQFGPYSHVIHHLITGTPILAKEILKHI